jgi:membrane protein YdbS with pleckstrin-like domain
MSIKMPDNAPQWFGILMLWGLVRGLGAFVGIVLMFVQSPLPWWVLTPAAIALIVGFVFLFKIRMRMRRARISPNRKFAGS